MDAYTRAPGGAEQQTFLTSMTEKVENFLDKVFTPVKPHLGTIARFLICSTFLEDSLRIVVQWPEQVWFLENFRAYGYTFAVIFLGTNVVVMTACSILAILKRYTPHCSLLLFLMQVSQAFGYGLLFDYRFILRTLSVIGGLLMLVADSMASQRRTLFAGLPELQSQDKTVYFSLFGRILLIPLVFTLVIGSEFTVTRIIVASISTVACMMVAVGFKARYSSVFLIVFLSIANVFLNGWWSLHESHPDRDFKKFDFFQTLSVMGGFLLLANLGPGGMSMDEKKKY